MSRIIINSCSECPFYNGLGCAPCCDAIKDCLPVEINPESEIREDCPYSNDEYNKLKNNPNILI